MNLEFTPGVQYAAGKVGKNNNVFTLSPEFVNELDNISTILMLFGFNARLENDKLKITFENSDLLTVLKIILHSRPPSNFNSFEDNVNFEALRDKSRQEHSDPAYLAGRLVELYKVDQESQKQEQPNIVDRVLFENMVVKPLRQEALRLDLKISALRNKADKLNDNDPKKTILEHSIRSYFRRRMALSVSITELKCEKLKITADTGLSSRSDAVARIFKDLNQNSDIEAYKPYQKILKRLANAFTLVATGVLPGVIKYGVTSSLFFSVQGKTKDRAAQSQANFEKISKLNTHLEKLCFGRKRNFL